MKIRGGFVGTLSGSMGGITASRNRFGQYLRNRSTPVNPSSSRQQQVRSTFASLAHKWSNDLSESDRDRWNLYAANVTVPDPFGQPINLTGFNMYLRTNTVAVLAGVPEIDAGPAIFTLAASDDLMAGVLDEANEEVSVSFDDTLAWLDEDDAAMVIAVSIPQNAGQAFLKPQFRVAGVILGDSTTAPTTPQVFDSPWPVSQGQKLMTQGRILRADGRLSDPFRESSIVTS